MSLAVLVMIDGLCPDPLRDYEQRYPNLTALRRRGAWTLNGSSIMPTLTLPCHMCIFHSVPPSRHGVTSNQWVPMEDPIPGLVELAHAAGHRTAIFYSWENLRDVTRPGSLSYASFTAQKYILPYGDVAVLEEALRYLSSPRDGFMFVYFGNVDTAGEEHGFMTERYLAQVEIVDQLLGRLLGGLPAGAAVLVLADHGGFDHDHGTDLPEEMTIPWLVAGPGIKRNYEIQSQVTLLDTAPTLARILGFEPHPDLQGHCIEEIFETQKE